MFERDFIKRARYTGIKLGAEELHIMRRVTWHYAIVHPSNDARTGISPSFPFLPEDLCHFFSLSPSFSLSILVFLVSLEWNSNNRQTWLTRQIRYTAFPISVLFTFLKATHFSYVSFLLLLLIIVVSTIFRLSSMDRIETFRRRGDNNIRH